MSFTVGTLILVWITLLTTLSIHSVIALQNKNLDSAQKSASVAAWLIVPLDKTLGVFISDVRLWARSLELVSVLGETKKIVTLYVPATFSGAPEARELAHELTLTLPEVKATSFAWIDSYQRAFFLRKIIDSRINDLDFVKEALKDPAELKENITQITTVGEHFLRGNHRYLILLQNSDELRPTGGFPGSYARFQIEDGVIRLFDVQDIYTPDGQYTGFTEPPPGVKEYLSSGNGLRLPDANWNPDFPAASQDLLQFFALGKENDVEGLVAINLSIAEQLLHFTGPIYLPDYNQTVTADNLSSLARSDRDQFFAGSQQKRSFLQTLFTQFKLRFTQLEPAQVSELTKIFSQAQKNKNIQAFSTAQPVQKFFEHFSLTGNIATQKSSHYFFLVEANVGINKVNRLINREVNLSLQETTTSLTATFTNQNPHTTLQSQRGEYINYQRIFIPMSHTVSSIMIGGKPLEKWDESIVSTYAGEKLRQVGFLFPVPAEQTRWFTIQLNHPALPLDTLVLQKQSGVPPTSYTIITPRFSKEIILDQDEVISFATMHL